MSSTRRHFITRGATLAAAGSLSALPRPLHAIPHVGTRSRGDGPHHESVPLFDDPRLKSLTEASLSAARAAGATYADVRLTHTYTKRCGGHGVISMSGNPPEAEVMTIGVRVLADGYWGFASSPVWTVDEAARLARAAVHNAKVNTLGKPRTLELAPMASIANGHWTTPIIDDPFMMSRDEIEDYIVGIGLFTRRIPRGHLIRFDAKFVKQDKTFASTADQYYTQRLYRASGNITVSVTSEDGKRPPRTADLWTLTPAGAGFEYFRGQPIRDQIVALIEELKEELSLPSKPVDVGRYTTIIDAPSVAGLISGSIGNATELDRALGYEANAGGTSYITDPATMVGTFKVGAPNITITANRSEPSGAATVRWDDEGVTPDEWTIVKDGIIADMQTDREGASFLKDVYEQRRQPVVSHGCAHSPEGGLAPLVHCANLRLTPSATEETLDSIVAGTSKGVQIKRATTTMDFQQSTGLSIGAAFEIKNGKRVAILSGAGVIFRTPELWSSVIVMGGDASQRRLGFGSSKGQPSQSSYHSVSAVPLILKDMTIIDSTRRA